MLIICLIGVFKCASTLSEFTKYSLVIATNEAGVSTVTDEVCYYVKKIDPI